MEQELKSPAGFSVPLQSRLGLRKEAILTDVM